MMMMRSRTNCVIKNCVILNVFFAFCGCVCEIYFANEYQIICVSKDNIKTSYYERIYMKLATVCDDFKVDHNMIPHHRHFVSEDCILKPWGFKVLTPTDVQSFTTGNQNPSRVLQSSIFRGICNVHTILLSSANIRTIEPGAFFCANRTERLDLSNNQIEVLPPSIFEDMPGLIFMNLSLNRINVLQKNLFGGLKNLQGIDLGSNLLTELPDGLFHRLQTLKSLNLEKNQLENLDRYAFLNLTRLQHLSLSFNKLKSLENTFWKNHQLRVLLATDNQIQIVSKQVFVETENLEMLYIGRNRLQRIVSETFGALRKLTFLSLAFNEIAELKGGPFLNNSLIGYLDLSFNNLTEIKSDDFKGLKYLQTLVLISNSITDIDIGSLQHMPLLSHLFMDSNHLSSLPEGIVSNTAVKKLSLNDNELKNLSNVFRDSQIADLSLKRNVGLILNNDTFAGLTQLLSLNLEECDIASIPDGIFENTPQLRHIKMYNNKIYAITPNSFAPLDIEELDLSYNRIKKIKNRSFSKNKRLLFLNASHNEIMKVEEDAFQDSNLQVLDVSSNFLTEFVPRRFPLIFLNIGNNSIASLDGIFGVSEFLFYLHIDSNNLTNISTEQWKRVFRMQMFSAKYNNMQEVFIPEVIKVENRPKIHLEHNKVRKVHIPSNMLHKSNESSVPTKKTVDPDILLKIFLSKNPISCDCFAYELYIYLNNFDRNQDYVEFEDDLLCDQPLQLHGKKLGDLSPTDLVCNYVEDSSYFQSNLPAYDCMETCKCLYRPHGEFRTVNCSNRDLENLPTDVPRFTNLLDLTHNSITSIVELNQSLWENLTKIYLESNAVDSAEFSIPDQVTFLSLKDNKLTRFPISVRKQAEKTGNFQVSLSRNPWSCDCSLLPLKEFILVHENQVIDAKDITCTFANGSTAYILRITYAELCPNLTETKIPIAVYVVGIFIILVSIAVAAFYYKYKLYILAFLYTHCSGCYRIFCCHKPIDEDKIFDGFISYSSEDGEIALNILQELELKPPKYQFCIHERNWMPGSLITNNILYSVRNSRKTLVVLSETFIASQWFKLEFDAAFNQTIRDKRDRLILILKGKVPDVSQLPDNVRYVLKTKTYLEWGERWFFEKLRYAMHVQKPFVDQNGRWGISRFLSCFQKEHDPPQLDIELTS